MECQELRWNDLREENLAYAASYLFLSVIYFRFGDYYTASWRLIRNNELLSHPELQSTRERLCIMISRLIDHITEKVILLRNLRY